MADLLKDMFNSDSLGELAAAFKSSYKPFQADRFLKFVMDDSWESL